MSLRSSAAGSRWSGREQPAVRCRDFAGLPMSIPCSASANGSCHAGPKVGVASHRFNNRNILGTKPGAGRGGRIAQRSAMLQQAASRSSASTSLNSSTDSKSLRNSFLARENSLQMSERAYFALSYRGPRIASSQQYPARSTSPVAGSLANRGISVAIPALSHSHGPHPWPAPATAALITAASCAPE